MKKVSTSDDVLAVLLMIRTVDEMTKAFSDEARCRCLVEAMVWPKGQICSACGYERSIAIAWRDMGKHRARPEIGFCWSQRIAAGTTTRKTRTGRGITQTCWSRLPPALQLPNVFRAVIVRPNTTNSRRRHRHQITGSCLWLITAAQDFELSLFRLPQECITQNALVFLF
ncbi:transposase [Martelella mediterranea]|uniref:hypothetical protein n=1 Tax=Martelella mediterranea TaxID=293089 RepID=UPI003AF3C98D|nr:transposase [Martelella mediterranea]